MKNAIKYIAGAVAVVLTVDALGFVAWVASGQVPADAFYIGSITAHILRAVFF